MFAATRAFATFSQGAQAELITDGLQLFLDADDSSSYPGSGTTWTDLSGNGNNFTLSSAAAFTDSGGVKFMNFESEYALKSPGVSSYAAATVMVFSTIKASTASYRTLLRGSSDHQVFINTGSDLLGTYNVGFVSSGFDITTLPNPSTQFNCLTFKLGTSSPYFDFSYNGGGTSATITNASATFDDSLIYIGGIGSPNQNWGKVAVVLYYNRHLTDDEIDSNYNYFKPRYGLP